MKRLLAICPTRNRPDALVEMLTSFHATHSQGTHLLIYISPCDPRYQDYRVIARSLPPDTEMIEGPRRFITETYNIFSTERVYDYYSSVNDDHFFVTPEWDKRLIDVVEAKGKGWGCAMAADKLTDWSKHPHPSGCVISGKIVRTLGYLFYPKLHHIGNDVLLGRLLKDLGLLFEAPEIIIEHRHWSNGYRPMDDNYKWIYGKEEQDYGDAAMKDYLFNQYHTDKKKIQEAMAK